VPTPNPSTCLNDPVSVSCTGPARCAATGSASVGIDPQTLVESWHGSAWTVVPNPDVPGKINSLSGVSCTGPTSCVAVGTTRDEDNYDFQTLVERWNGVTWSIVPGTGLVGGGYLSDVSCTGATDCTAVGWDNDGNTLVLEGDGSSWSAVPSPDVAGSNDALNGVGCRSATFCAAVGDSIANATGVTSTLEEAWNGSSWSIEPTPEVTGPESVLNDVFCSSTAACVATGSAPRVSRRG